MEFLTPYMYLWPNLFILPILLIIIMLFISFYIGITCLTLYYLTPEYIIDSIIKSIIRFVKNFFYLHFNFVETNIKNTFQIRIKEKIPDKSILIWSPHGLMTVACSIHNGFQVTDSKYSPTKIAALSCLHSFPVSKDIMRVANTISSDYETIKNTLKKESISIMLGGVKEVLHTSPNKLILTIKKRYGIFKLALETGSDIVPVITYGENEIFPPNTSIIPYSINFILYSFFKVALPFPTLESIQNWMKLCIKPLDPIITYTGSPIKVKKVYPSHKRIELLKKKYISAVKKLFEETNPGNYSLEIT